MSEPKILPFDLAAAERGVKVVTRVGHNPVTDITLFKDKKGDWPLAGVINGELVTRTKEGTVSCKPSNTADGDFVMLIEPKMGYPLSVYSLSGSGSHFLFNTEERRQVQIGVYSRPGAGTYHLVLGAPVEYQLNK